MDKLELKHLVGYLPYRLKVMWDYNDEDCELSVIDTFRNNVSLFYKTLWSYVELTEIKPILRPLSDLLNPAYLQFFRPVIGCEYNGNELISKIENKGVAMHDLTCLYMHHFDIHGLINKGLAIDINTL